MILEEISGVVIGDSDSVVGSCEGLQEEGDEGPGNNKKEGLEAIQLSTHDHGVSRLQTQKRNGDCLESPLMWMWSAKRG